MRIEAFSQGKDPDRPDANEDRFLVLPGRGYAVIDGVTDRVGARYDGMLAGQYGATLVEQALAELLGRRDLPDDARLLVPALTAAIAEAYARHGTLERARADWNYRFATTLALVLERADHLELLLIGDSGVRLGGERDLRLDKDLDLVTATLRGVAWALIAERSAEPARREATSRLVAWHGTRQDPTALAGTLDAADLAAIERDAIAGALARLPALPRGDVERLVRGGVVHAQGHYQNDAASPLGYSCLDGFAVAMRFVHHERVARAGLGTVELYTDGYFRAGDGFGVDAWERAFAAVEAEDPAKIGRYPSVKGSLGRIKADDRTYLGIDFRA